MNIIKKIKISALSTALLLFITGCRLVFFEPNAENLMEAPLSQEQSEIYQVIKEDIGEDFTHIYPDSGEYRYSYIFDQDGKGNERGLVFYKTVENPSVRIAFIKKTKDTWSAVGSISSRADGVDCVEFANLSGEENNINLIVGYTLFSGDKTLVVYDWDEEIAVPVFEESYNQFITIEKQEGNGSEPDSRSYPKQLILTGTVFGEDANVVKLVTKINEEYVVDEQNTYLLKSNTLEYSRLSAEKRSKFNLVYIDQLFGQGVRIDFYDEETGKSNDEQEIREIRTEIFIISEDGFLPILPNWELTQRPYGYGSYSMDIDEDGIIEIPTSNIVNAIQISGDGRSRERVSIISWMEVELENLNPSTAYYAEDIYTVRNEEGDYNFIIPPQWLNKVSIRAEHVKNDGSYLHFYTISTPEFAQEERVLTIFAKEIESQDENSEIIGYQHIMTNSYFSYYTNVNYEIKNTTVEPIVFRDIWSSLIPKLGDL